MNTIPTTFKRVRVPYTVVGGRKAESVRKFPMTLTILVLKRAGNPFRDEVLERLERLPADEIVSVEGPAPSYEVENLAKRHPKVKFLLLHENATPGEQVNIGMEESGGSYVLLIWDDMAVSPGMINERVMEAIVGEECLCVAPLVQNQRSETLPTVAIPAFHGKMLKVITLQPSADGMMSLFPFDYCGVYTRERFFRLGGYDYGLTNPYWQKVDFGFRAFMWGDSVKTSTALRISYLDDVPLEDTSPDESYRIFYLKNLGVRFSSDIGILPYSRLLPYLFRTGGDPLAAYREFNAVRKWVATNKYRYTRDSRSVTELWEVPDP